MSTENGPRNSMIREKTATIINSAVEIAHRKFPWLHPDHLNAAPVVGIAVVTACLVKEGAKSKLAKIGSGTAFTALSLLDAFDGALARLMDKENPGSIDFNGGQRKDAASDRLQETILGVGRAILAHQRHDKLGEVAALTATISNPLPSLIRALAESRGQVVPEGGRDPIGFLGTRVGRAPTAIIDTAFPEINGIRNQTIFDILTTASNVITAMRRGRVAFNEQHPQTLTGETVVQAQTRVKDMTFFAGVAGVSALLTYALLNKKK